MLKTGIKINIKPTVQWRTVIGIFIWIVLGCKEGNEDDSRTEEPDSFYFGADLSYVNQILDHNGVYKDDEEIRSPYRIFKDHGANLVRLRLWHNPTWTKEVYGEDGTQMYSDLADVEKSIALAREEGMQVLLDFHYSDVWADPGKQEIPAAWIDIKEKDILVDSMYNYTFAVLSHLNARGLMPEFVQIGNEINCGMMFSNAPPDFPKCNVCDGHWKNLGDVIKSGIKAVRDVSGTSSIKTKIILHVADPKNVEWWFDNITGTGQVTDFEVIGFSYYPIWHNTVSLDQLSENVNHFKSKFGKEVMILETAYPWTVQGNDSYNNIFGSQAPLPGFPYTQRGQLDMMKTITQEVMEGNGSGIIYWEPAWITSDMKDLWGTGSAWENSTFFDYDGNVIAGIDFMNFSYKSD